MGWASDSLIGMPRCAVIRQFGSALFPTPQVPLTPAPIHTAQMLEATTPNAQPSNPHYRTRKPSTARLNVEQCICGEWPQCAVKHCRRSCWMEVIIEKWFCAGSCKCDQGGRSRRRDSLPDFANPNCHCAISPTRRKFAAKEGKWHNHRLP
jgi:hypothetical protein